MGGNDGTMLRQSLSPSATAVCCDIDHSAIERCYLLEKQGGGENLLPLLQDFTNPSPSLGFASKERDSFIARCQADLVLALALIHHLAISHNLPFSYVADFIASLGDNCIVEFVPKNDSQIQRLLANRKDIFPDYTEQKFEEAFGQKFVLALKRPLPESGRILYLYRKR
jgi:hypothetical protein